MWLEGASWAEISTSRGFRSLLVLACVLVPSSLVIGGIGSNWRETPLATWFGVSPHDPDEDWAIRARDTDKDGMPDF